MMLQSESSPINCPLCNAVCSKKETSLKKKLSLFACLECGLHFVYPRTPLAEDIYDDDYYRSWGMGDNGLPAHVILLKETNMRRHVNEIKKYVQSGRILEIGSAMGSFLKVAQESGFNAIGVEVSKQACSLARSHVGDESVLNDTLENVDLEEGSMDVIFMSDLIEHISHPLPFLEKAMRLLKKGGILYFVTPDPEHWSRFIFRKNWVHFKDEHPVFFARRTFLWVAKRFHCKVIDFSTAYKYINLQYLKAQLMHFEYSLSGRILSIIEPFLPSNVREHLFPVSLGESRCIIQKRGD